MNWIESEIAKVGLDKARIGANYTDMRSLSRVGFMIIRRLPRADIFMIFYTSR